MWTENEGGDGQKKSNKYVDVIYGSPLLLIKFPPEEGDVCDGEAEGVDLGEALLVGERRHVQPQLLERRVDARRAARHNNSLQ